ncbi:MAG: hypothetical protein D6744_10720, partial [Planctomycetota bacterium]
MPEAALALSRDDFEALLGAARENGQLSALDVQFARALARWSCCDDDVRLPVALAGAAASSALGGQDICIDLGREPPSWWTGYDPDALRESLAASDVVGDTGSALPLVLEGDRLYLQIMARRERLIAERMLAMAGEKIDYAEP